MKAIAIAISRIHILRPLHPRQHIRGPVLQHSLTSQNTDLVSPSDSCPLFYHLHRPATASGAVGGPLAHLIHQTSQTQTESLKSGSNGSESPDIPPPPPPPQLSA